MLRVRICVEIPTGNANSGKDHVTNAIIHRLGTELTHNASQVMTFLLEKKQTNKTRLECLPA